MDILAYLRLSVFRVRILLRNGFHQLPALHTKRLIVLPQWAQLLRLVESSALSCVPSLRRSVTDFVISVWLCAWMAERYWCWRLARLLCLDTRQAKRVTWWCRLCGVTRKRSILEPERCFQRALWCCSLSTAQWSKLPYHWLNFLLLLSSNFWIIDCHCSAKEVKQPSRPITTHPLIFELFEL